MTKAYFMKRHGLVLRPVTAEDRAVARTDYQREADYIMEYKGSEWFSKRGTLKDMQYMVETLGD